MQQNLFPEKREGEKCGIQSLDGLNPAQHAAVTHGDGPLLIIAGAGSGKTRTLVHRVAHLIEQGIPPSSILLLTFTRRAAQEMLRRAERIAGQHCHQVVGGTFHATANMLLRRHGHYLGYGANFTIIDRSDSEGIINLLKSSLGFAGAGKRFPSKRMIMNILSGVINKSRSLEELVYDQHGHLAEFMEQMETIQQHYHQFKLDHGLMDYDDLLVNWRRLLQESEQARDEIRSRFRHILVDEYQDTNHIQAEIVRLLAVGHNNVTVVGDDAQSIYSFRGADFYNILRFPEQFPGTTIIKLEQNYRSTQPILSLTNSIIGQAKEKFTKTLFTEIEGGVRPVCFPARSEAAEARFVVETIERLVNDGVDIAEIAVLFRSGFHSYKLEMELASRSHIFEKRGGLKLTESAHIKDILSFFRILVNPWDNLSWSRILLQLDKLGPKTAQKILDGIRKQDDPIAALAAYKAAPGWKAGFDKLVALFTETRQDEPAPAVLFDLIMTYYEPIFEKLYYDDYPKRRKELDQIKVLIAGYGDLQSLVDDTALDPPESVVAASDDRARLVLSTIHSAKGLEWEVVFVIGLAEGRFPHQNAFQCEQWEEERRLLYVAATRAKKQLFLTYPREMMTPEHTLRHTMMSPLLQEINPGLYENLQMRPEPSATYYTVPDSTLAKGAVQRQRGKSTTLFTPGMIVRHAYFGRGTVKETYGSKRVEVHFDRHGDKILHLDYAKLEPVE